MAGLPTQSDLASRQQQAQERLRELKDKYNEFVNFWETFQKEEADLLKEVHQHLDKEKLQVILKHIDNNP